MIQNDILLQYGRLGMKWGQHKFSKNRSAQSAAVRNAKHNMAVAKSSYSAIKKKARITPTSENKLAKTIAKQKYIDSKSEYKISKIKSKMSNPESDNNSSTVKKSDYIKNKHGITEEGRELKNIRAYNNRERMSTASIKKFTDRLNAENAMKDAVYRRSNEEIKRNNEAKQKKERQRQQNLKRLTTIAKYTAATVAAVGVEHLANRAMSPEKYGLTAVKDSSTGKVTLKGSRKNINLYKKSTRIPLSIKKNSKIINSILRSYGNTKSK